MLVPGKWRFASTPEELGLLKPDWTELLVTIPKSLVDSSTDTVSRSKDFIANLRKKWTDALSVVLSQTGQNRRVVIEGRPWVVDFLLRGKPGFLPTTIEGVSNWLNGLFGLSTEDAVRCEISDFRIGKRDAERVIKEALDIQPDSEFGRLLLRFSRRGKSLLNDEYIIPLLIRGKNLGLETLKKDVDVIENAQAKFAPKSIVKSLMTMPNGTLVLESGIAVTPSIQSVLPRLIGEIAKVEIPLLGVALVLIELLEGYTEKREGDTSGFVDFYDSWNILPDERKNLVTEEIDSRVRLVPGTAKAFFDQFFGCSRAEFERKLKSVSERVDGIERTLNNLLAELQQIRNDHDEEARGFFRYPSQLGIDLRGESVVLLTERITGGGEVTLVTDGNYRKHLDKLQEGLSAGKIVILRGPKGVGKSTLARVALALFLHEENCDFVCDSEVFTSNPILLEKAHGLFSSGFGVVLYDPFNPILYSPEHLQYGAGRAYQPRGTTSDPSQIVSWILARNARESAPAVLVLPDDQYDSFVAAIPSSERHRFREDKVELASWDFVGRIVKAYARNSPPQDDRLSEIASELCKFQDGYVLSAAYAGRALAEGLSLDATRQIVFHAESDSKLFFQFYMWYMIVGITERRENPDFLRQFAQVLIVRSDLGSIPASLARSLMLSKTLDPILQDLAKAAQQDNPENLRDPMLPWSKDGREAMAFRRIFVETDLDLDPPYDALLKWLCRPHEDILESSIDNLLEIARGGMPIPQSLIPMSSLMEALTVELKGYDAPTNSELRRTLVRVQTILAFVLNTKIINAAKAGTNSEARRILDAILLAYVYSIAHWRPRKSLIAIDQSIERLLFVGELMPPSVQFLLAGQYPFVPGIPYLLRTREIDYEARLAKARAEFPTGTDATSLEVFPPLSYAAILAWSGGMKNAQTARNVLWAVSKAIALGPTSAQEFHEAIGNWALISLIPKMLTNIDSIDPTLTCDIAAYLNGLYSFLPETGEEDFLKFPAGYSLNLFDPIFEVELLGPVATLATKSKDWVTKIEFQRLLVKMSLRSAREDALSVVDSISESLRSWGPEIFRLCQVEVNTLMALVSSRRSTIDLSKTRSDLETLRQNVDATMTKWLTRSELGTNGMETPQSWSARVEGQLLWAESEAAYHKMNHQEAWDKLDKLLSLGLQLDGQTYVKAAIRKYQIYLFAGNPPEGIAKEVSSLWDMIQRNREIPASLIGKVLCLHLEVQAPDDVEPLLRTEDVRIFIDRNPIISITTWALLALEGYPVLERLKRAISVASGAVGPEWARNVVSLARGSLSDESVKNNLAKSKELTPEVVNEILSLHQSDPKQFPEKVAHLLKRFFGISDSTYECLQSTGELVLDSLLLSRLGRALPAVMALCYLSSDEEARSKVWDFALPSDGDLPVELITKIRESGTDLRNARPALESILLLTL